MFAFLATYLYSKQSLSGTLKSSDKKNNYLIASGL